MQMLSAIFGLEMRVGLVPQPAATRVISIAHRFHTLQSKSAQAYGPTSERKPIARSDIFHAISCLLTLQRRLLSAYGHNHPSTKLRQYKVGHDQAGFRKTLKSSLIENFNKFKIQPMIDKYYLAMSVCKDEQSHHKEKRRWRKPLISALPKFIVYLKSFAIGPQDEIL